MTVEALGLFCDDVRDELGGTHSIIGVYPDNLDIPTVPVTVPRLSMYVRLNVDSDDDPCEFSLFLIHADGEEHPLQKMQADYVAGGLAMSRHQQNPKTGFIAKSFIMGLQVKNFGRMKVVVRFTDKEITAATLNVRPAP
jgi:hypothetical protein